MRENPERMKFPQDFLFGTANADHQVEAHDPACEDVWDAWERSQRLTPRGRGTDFANRYADDVQAAADMGCRLFRFSVSWARVETEDGVFDEAALDHYRQVAACIRSHRMKVMLTLHHFVWPVWLERERGGMLGADFPDLFARYADRVAEKTGDLVDYWITFNEPSQLTFGYIKPWWRTRYYMPPGLPRGSDVDTEAEAVGRLVPNLFRAHARARTAIRNQHTDAKVGVNPLMTGFPTWLQMLMDWGACHRGLGEALFKFTTSGPLVNERAGVDILIENHSGTEARVTAVPPGHGRLLAMVNEVVAGLRGETSGQTPEPPPPVSLHELWEEPRSLPHGLGEGRNLGRLRKRGVLRVALRNDAPQDGLEIQLARRIAQSLFGDERRIKIIRVAPDKRFRLLRAKSRWLNWAWRFWGTTSLIANANWWYLGMSGRLPGELCPPEAVGAQDFVGVDYYWGLPTRRLHQFRLLEDAAHGRFLQAPVWPQGLYHSLRRMHRWFPGMEIFIVENGSVPVASGVKRADYLKQHLRQVLKALAAGVPVKGYNFWSITSNREWGHPFDPNTDFGLHFVDLDKDPELKRHPTRDVACYREIIHSGEVPDG